MVVVDEVIASDVIDGNRDKGDKDWDERDCGKKSDSRHTRANDGCCR